MKTVWRDKDGKAFESMPLPDALAKGLITDTQLQSANLARQELVCCAIYARAQQF